MDGLQFGGAINSAALEHCYMCLLVKFNPGLFGVYLRTELMSHMFSLGDTTNSFPSVLVPTY